MRRSILLLLLLLVNCIYGRENPKQIWERVLHSVSFIKGNVVAHSKSEAIINIDDIYYTSGKLNDSTNITLSIMSPSDNIEWIRTNEQYYFIVDSEHEYSFNICGPYDKLLIYQDSVVINQLILQGLSMDPLNFSKKFKIYSFEDYRSKVGYRIHQDEFVRIVLWIKNSYKFNWNKTKIKTRKKKMVRLQGSVLADAIYNQLNK